jgi:hypothetical protein
MVRTRFRLGQLQYSIVADRFVSAATKLFDRIEKYNPNQPRISAGSPEGGQWTTSNGSRVAGKWNSANYAKCEAQYESDILQCRMMLWNPFCEDQALSRRTACMKDLPIPPFFHTGDAR